MAAFSKRHYEALAAALKEAREAAHGLTDNLYGIGMAQAYITDVLVADNPLFDGERFAQASGMRDA